MKVDTLRLFTLLVRLSDPTDGEVTDLRRDHPYFVDFVLLALRGVGAQEEGLTSENIGRLLLRAFDSDELIDRIPREGLYISGNFWKFSEDPSPANRVKKRASIRPPLEILLGMRRAETVEVGLLLTGSTVGNSEEMAA